MTIELLHAAGGKRSRILKGVLITVKWLWLLLLAAALVACFLFEVKWRASVLLIVLIIMPTIIPRRVRKYIYATCSLVLVALVIWVFLPEDNEGWQPYVFKDEIAAFEARFQAPEEANAAGIYSRLVGWYDKEAWSKAAECLPYYTFVETADFVRQQAVAGPTADPNAVISMLLDAARLEKCWFVPPYGPAGLDAQYKRTNVLRLWARVLRDAASRDMEAHKTADALAKYQAALKMADHEYQQPTYVDMLMGGMFIEAPTLQAINKMVMTDPDLDANRLAEIDRLIGVRAFDWQADFPRLLDYNKLFVKHTAACGYEINAKKQIRRRMPYRLLGLPAQAAKVRTPLDELAAVALWLAWPSPDQISRRVDRNFARFYAMAQSDYEWPQPPPVARAEFPLFAVIRPSGDAFHIYHYAYVRLCDQRAAARLLIRLRQKHLTDGVYPESIDAVAGRGDLPIDPWMTRNLVYRREGEGFVLYHTGDNGLDDSGPNDHIARTDDIAIWPPAPLE